MGRTAPRASAADDHAINDTKNHFGHGLLAGECVDEAIVDLSRAIRLGRDEAAAPLAEVYEARGRAFKKKGRIDDAVADFVEVQRLLADARDRGTTNAPERTGGSGDSVRTGGIDRQEK